MNFEVMGETVEASRIQEASELPESIELLERPEETLEIRVETQEIGEGLELHVRVKESAEVPDESPYKYSKAYIDPEGVYHPEQISGIYRDVLEDPAHQKIVESLNNWQHQERPLSCVIQCQRMSINTLNHASLTEAELRKTGKELDLYTDLRGTYLSDVGKLAEYHGLEREQFENATISDLVELKEQGDDLIVGVDTLMLERPYLQKPATVNHAVMILDFDFSDRSNPKVILNDPGRSEGMGSAYPLEVFQRAACKINRESGGQEFVSATAIRKKEG